MTANEHCRGLNVIRNQAATFESRRRTMVNNLKECAQRTLETRILRGIHPR